MNSSPKKYGSMPACWIRGRKKAWKESPAGGEMLPVATSLEMLLARLASRAGLPVNEGASWPLQRLLRFLHYVKP